MKKNECENIIYETLKNKNGSASISWLSKILNLNKIEVKKALVSLQRQKKIARVSSKVYGIVESAKDKKTAPAKGKAQRRGSGLLEGRIEAHPDGYAFFVPAKGGDLFIPSSRLNGALHGDIVRVKASRFKGRPEAHVVEIVERCITKLVGRVEERKSHYLVIAFHRKFNQPLYVRKSHGDDYKTDDIVQCEITQYPECLARSKFVRAEGKILKKLGHIDDKGIENLIVMSKYGLEKTAPEEVTAIANRAAENLPAVNNPGRTDFRDLFTVTIDGETARDFDDAISIEKGAKGHSLYVHIADVAHYVRTGTALDADAYSRGTSVYFPEFAIPMLPESLSTGACSLRPDEDRFTVSVKIDYTPEGNRHKAKFYQGVIRSNHRLTYTYVNEVLAGKKALNKELGNLIEDAAALTELIKKRRLANGTIDFDLPDVDFIFDENGDIIDIKPEERGFSERIIEHFMIEANEATAELLSEKAPASVFRNHERPDYAKIEQWVSNAAKLGFSPGTIPGEITGAVVGGWFKKIDTSLYSYLLKSMLVRSMQRAEYAAENLGHFGLGSGFYTHFTSPIRRYPDLIVHRLLKKYIFGEKIDIDPGELDVMAKHCSARERNAEDAEREVHLYKKLAFLRNNPGREYAAYINRVASTGFYVFLSELLMVGYVDSSMLPKGRYDFDTEKCAVYNRRGGIVLRLGEELGVIWVSSDWDRLEANFAPSAFANV